MAAHGLATAFFSFPAAVSSAGAHNAPAGRLTSGGLALLAVAGDGLTSGRLAVPGGSAAAWGSSRVRCTSDGLTSRRLAVLAVVVPGGSPVPESSRAGGSRGVRMLALPASTLSSGWLVLPAVAVPGGRAGHGAVCFQADGPTSDGEMEDFPKSFSEAMDEIERNYRPLVLLGSNEILREVMTTAQCSKELLAELMMEGIDVTNDIYEEAVRIGESFVMVDKQCREGYLEAHTLVAAMNGLKKVCEMFVPNLGYLPPYADTIPVSSDDVDKGVYFGEMANAFHILHCAVYWELRKMFTHKF